MEFNIRNLDGRSRGYSYGANQFGINGFTVLAEYAKYGLEDREKTTFVCDAIKLRDWCTSTWGPSFDLTFWKGHRRAYIGHVIGDEEFAGSLQPNQHWAYELDATAKRSLFLIYFASKKEASMLKLRWS